MAPGGLGLAGRHILTWLLACGGGMVPEVADDCEATWGSVGQPFVSTWCTTCHASGLTGPDRFGAPVALDLDTLDDVRAHLDAVKGTVQAQTMPPSGPAPAEEADRFVGWLACGAPGTDPGEDLPCGGALAEGDRIVSAGPGPCPDHTAIAGDLVVDAPIDESYRCLCAVEGTVEISSSVSLLELTQAGAVHVSGDAETVSLPRLGSVDGAVAATGPGVQELSLPLLSTAGGIAIADVPALGTLGLFRLDAVAGDLTVAGAPGLVDLSSLDALTQVGGAVVLEDLGGVDVPILRRLVTVGGDLVVLGDRDRAILDGLDALEAVGGDLVIAEHPVLSELPAAPGPVGVGGEVVVRDNPLLPADEVAAFLDRLAAPP